MDVTMAQYDIRCPRTRILAALVTVLAAFLLIIADAPARAGGHEVSGAANVIDGQTMEIEGRRISLHAIAAPRLDQVCEWPDKKIPCGDVSRTALMDLVIAATVNCRFVEGIAPRDDGAVDALCEIDGFDVGRNMVHTGWAVADRRVSDVYADTEVKARSAKRGLWKGTFTMPWDN